jgi:hypothetical protein
MLITAFREFCYRWTCRLCGHDNRSGEVVAGDHRLCDKCLSESQIATVIYDNGCTITTVIKTKD